MINTTTNKNSATNWITNRTSTSDRVKLVENFIHLDLVQNNLASKKSGNQRLRKISTWFQLMSYNSLKACRPFELASVEVVARWPCPRPRTLPDWSSLSNRGRMKQRLSMAPPHCVQREAPGGACHWFPREPPLHLSNELYKQTNVYYFRKA